MRVVVIIQARMGSTRLPGKMMMKVNGKPIIGYVVERLGHSKEVNSIWLATTTNKEDDILVSWAEKKEIPYFRGSEDDVLDRYYQTAKQANAGVVVRITGDCPLLDSIVVDNIIVEYKNNTYDYVCNSQPPTFPDGLDVEVFSFVALERAWKEAKSVSEREHVTSYIWKHPKIFSIKNVQYIQDISSHRWTLDTEDDFTLITHILEALKEKNLYGHLEEIEKILEEHPEWLKINSHYMRNEGYAKSVKEDYSQSG